MNYKPGDFLVGVIDVFAILLPGALLSFFTMELAQTSIFGVMLPPIRDSAQGWVIFVFASYLLGHFVFLLGAHLDWIYDFFRKRYIRVEHERAYQRAKAIKEKYLNDKEQSVTNTFQWAKANIQVRSPSAAVEIHRLEADSKFFRSLIVVLLVISIFLVYRSGWSQLFVCLVLVALSFWRYFDQRLKSTNIAYTYLMVLESLPKPEPPSK
jgi:ABC-type siderophore export system fused ATPase/permease subunit